MNEVTTKDTFSMMLTNALEEQKTALPANFNIPRFVQNSVALLNGNENLARFAQQHGTAQIKAGLIRGAFLGLDALNGEMYLVPYGSTLNFMASYKGMVKMAHRYSVRPIKMMYAKVIREGDVFEESIHNGEPTIDYKPLFNNKADILGVFAVCLFHDGGMQYEVMSTEEVEQCRKQSKAKNSPAWNSFWTEMAKKTVIRRLAKSLPLDMDVAAMEMFDSGTEIETDIKEVTKRNIEENANTEEFVIDMEETT